MSIEDEIEKAKRLDFNPEAEEADAAEDDGQDAEIEDKLEEELVEKPSVQAIKFGIKKAEPPASNVAAVNVLEQCRFFISVATSYNCLDSSVIEHVLRVWEIES